MKCGIGKELRLALWPLASRAWSCHYLINSCQLQANLKLAHPSEMPCNCFTDSPLLPAPVEKAPELSQQAVLENRPTRTRSGIIVWLNRRQSKAKRKNESKQKIVRNYFCNFSDMVAWPRKFCWKEKKRKHWPATVATVNYWPWKGWQKIAQLQEKLNLRDFARLGLQRWAVWHHLGGCIAQRKHTCLSPSSLRFDS